MVVLRPTALGRPGSASMASTCMPDFQDLGFRGKKLCGGKQSCCALPWSAGPAARSWPPSMENSRGLHNIETPVGSRVNRLSKGTVLVLRATSVGQPGITSMASTCSHVRHMGIKDRELWCQGYRGEEIQQDTPPYWAGPASHSLHLQPRWAHVQRLRARR